MEPTAVRIGLMDSRRPGVVAMLQARHLRFGQRCWRAVRRLFVYGAGSLLVMNLLLLFIPIPWLHFCTIPVGIALGPIVAFVTWRQRVLLGKCELPCPKCRAPVEVPEGFPGWPARKNCLGCGIMVELDEAR